MIAVLLACQDVGQASRLPSEHAVGQASRLPTADITAITTTGEPGAYTFAVTIRSDETGCDRYADWWEVLDAQGALLYRRILAHSHPSEQPFTRAGGPVPIAADTPVWVRAHLAPGGYAGTAMAGSVAGGFSVAAPPEFPSSVERQAPQPDRCAF